MPQLQYLDIPTWGSALGQFGNAALGGYEQARQQRTEEDAVQDLISKLQSGENDPFIDIIGQKNLPFEKKKGFADLFNRADEIRVREEEAKNKRKQLNLEKDQKKREQNQPLQSALKRVDEMKKIREKGRLGLPLHATKHIRGQAARDKGAYETLGKSLISFASTIPIRNRLEFETLSETIFDPYISDAEASGILDKMRTIIEDSITHPEDNDESENRKKAGLQGAKGQRMSIGAIFE